MIADLQAENNLTYVLLHSVTIADLEAAKNSAAADAGCYIDVRSFGCRDGHYKNGYIRVNWKMVHQFHKSGIFLALVDPGTCVGRAFPPVYAISKLSPCYNNLHAYMNLVDDGQVWVCRRQSDFSTSNIVSLKRSDGLGGSTGLRANP